MIMKLYTVLGNPTTHAHSRVNLGNGSPPVNLVFNFRIGGLLKTQFRGLRKWKGFPPGLRPGRPGPDTSSLGPPPASASGPG